MLFLFSSSGYYNESVRQLFLPNFRVTETIGTVATHRTVEISPVFQRVLDEALIHETSRRRYDHEVGDSENPLKLETIVHDYPSCESGHQLIAENFRSLHYPRMQITDRKLHRYLKSQKK
jgi:hypothetical protein